MLEDIGGKLIAASTTFNWSTVELLAGDPAAAEEELRREYDRLEKIGETYTRSTVAGYLAVAIAAKGATRRPGVRVDRPKISTADDVISQAIWRSVRARVIARY